MAEFTDAIISIIDKKDKSIQASENKLFNKLPPTNKRVFKAVKDLIDKMNVSGGYIDFDDTNIDLIAQVDKTILDAIQSSGFPDSIAEYLRDFDTIKKFNVDIQKDVNELSPDELEDLINPIQKEVVQQTLDGLTGSGVNTNFVEPVRQGIFQNIAAGTTKAQLEQYLTNYIVGNGLTDGLYSRYVKQVSRDALNQFDGQVNSRIAEEFDLDAFRYVGSLIEDSRSQCVRWVKKRILQKSELDSEISWATNNGSGMISGTNKENFAVYRGGYNCRHSAIPFKLTPSQKKRLEEDQLIQQEETETKVEDQISEVTKKVETNQKKQEEIQKKESLNEEYFVSTQDEDINQKFFDVVADANGAARLQNKDSINIGLLDMEQSKDLFSEYSSSLFDDKQFADPYVIPVLDKGTAGACGSFSRTGETSGLSVKIAEGDKIIQKNYSKDLIEFSEDPRKFMQNNEKIFNKYGTEPSFNSNQSKNNLFAEGIENKKTGEITYKIWGIDSIAQLKDNNIAPVITHEFGHLIHNEYDPRINGGERSKIIKKAIERKINLSDAPTAYGETNWSEFWSESFASYVYAPEWFEKYHKKAFDFFLEMVDEYKIDRNSIIQYK